MSYRTHLCKVMYPRNKAIQECGEDTIIGRLVAGFSSQLSGFNLRSGCVGFVVDEVALGKDFSDDSRFLCQSAFHWLLHTRQSSGFDMVGLTVTCCLTAAFAAVCFTEYTHFPKTVLLHWPFCLFTADKKFLLRNLVSGIEGGTQTEGVWKQGVEEYI
jgi:hypothetical protein